MFADKLRLLVKVVLFLLIMIVWMISYGHLSEGAMYKYVDEDGTVVITDNPPPDFKIEPDQLPSSLAEEEKLRLEKEKQLEKKINLKRADTYTKDRQDRITRARSEFNKAQADEENYRLNVQQATQLTEKVRWRELLDKQQKIVKEKREKLNEIEKQP
jgi:hypothetical protein